MNSEQLEQMTTGAGFIAALDQSGGSTPKALAAYGIGEDEYSGDDEMFGKVHETRSRIMTNSAFTGDRVIAAILFENTMDRQVEGKDTGDYLWEEKRIVPLIKIDKGLADEANGAQIMKPMPQLADLLTRSVEKRMFGTKMRSVVKMANETGIEAVVAQQYEVGHQIIAAGLVPIIEPEVDIHSPEKAAAEAILRDKLTEHANQLSADQKIMLKLTLPEEDNFYSDLIAHPQIVRVVALSGGYDRDEANARLSRNNGMIASFSRALADDLSAQQSDEDFTASLNTTIQSICDASAT